MGLSISLPCTTRHRDFMSISSGEFDKDDWLTFEQAEKARSVEGLISLLPSHYPLGPLKKVYHPWGKDPQSVGALAASQLARLALQSTINASDFQSALMPVVQLLDEAEDRRNAAIAALAFITMLDINITLTEGFVLMRELLNLFRPLESSLPPDKAALQSQEIRFLALECMRNIYVENRELKMFFTRNGGIEAMLSMFDLNRHQISRVVEEIHQNVLNLSELIMDPDGQPILEIIYRCIDCGAMTYLTEIAHHLPGYRREAVEEGQCYVVEAIVLLEEDLTALRNTFADSTIHMDYDESSEYSYVLP